MRNTTGKIKLYDAEVDAAYAALHPAIRHYLKESFMGLLSPVEALSLQREAGVHATLTGLITYNLNLIAAHYGENHPSLEIDPSTYAIHLIKEHPSE